MNLSVVEDFAAKTDRTGKALVTLPTEGRKLTGRVEKVSIEVTRKVNLEWESGFHPDQVRSVVPAEGKSGRFPSHRREREIGDDRCSVRVSSPRSSKGNS